MDFSDKVKEMYRLNSKCCNGKRFRGAIGLFNLCKTQRKDILLKEKKEYPISETQDEVISFETVKSVQKYTDKEILHDESKNDHRGVLWYDGYISTWKRGDEEKNQATKDYKKKPSVEICEKLCSIDKECTGYFYTGTKARDKSFNKMCRLFSKEYNPKKNGTTKVGKRYSSDEIVKFKDVSV